MLLGIFLGQYCINALTYFFITWFPVYLVQARGMSILKAGFVASLPALCGFVGGVLGGVLSDCLLRMEYSLSVARKTPIVGGMLISTSMIACNYTDASGWSWRSWRWRSSARASARSAGRWCPTPSPKEITG